MKRIDFIGAPATGKSTLFNHLISLKSRKVLTPAEAHRLVISGYANGRGGQLALKKLVYSISPKGFSLGAKTRKSIVYEAGRELVLNGLWRDFIELLLDLVSENITDPGRRLEMTERMIYWIYEAAAVASHPSEAKVFYDFSLSQRAIDREFFEITRNSESTEKFFKELPPPELLIHLDTSAETLAERILNRSSQQLNPEHREVSREKLIERSEQSLKIVRSGAEILRERGVKVQTISTEADSGHNFEKAIKAIDSV